jgi:hypothetical protein
MNNDLVTSETLFWFSITFLIAARWVLCDAIRAWSTNKDAQRDHELRMLKIEKGIDDDE